MNDSPHRASRDHPLWSAADLRHALLRRASFPHAGRRRRRCDDALGHAGVSRRAIHRIGERAALALIRSGEREKAAEVLADLSRGDYHDERMLAIEILDRLAAAWPSWVSEQVAVLSRSLSHPWEADRLARVQGRLLARHPELLDKHLRWAISQNPLRRRAAALALLPRLRGIELPGVAASRARRVLRLLLQDPEPHPLVQQAVGQVLVHFAARAPRTVAELLRCEPMNLDPRHLEQAKRLVGNLDTAS